VLFPFCRGGGMRVFRWLADGCLFDDTLVILSFSVWLVAEACWFPSCCLRTRPVSGHLTSALSISISHPAIFTLIIGSYRVQGVALGYFLLASLTKGLLGEDPCGPGTHMRKTYTPPFLWKLMIFPDLVLMILPPVLLNETSLPAADR
jgi:hypothetical protein